MRRVHFDEKTKRDEIIDLIVPYYEMSPEERKHIWFSREEFCSMKRIAKLVASAVRDRGGNNPDTMTYSSAFIRAYVSSRNLPAESFDCSVKEVAAAATEEQSFRGLESYALQEVKNHRKSLAKTTIKSVLRMQRTVDLETQGNNSCLFRASTNQKNNLIRIASESLSYQARMFAHMIACADQIVANQIYGRQSEEMFSCPQSLSSRNSQLGPSFILLTQSHTMQNDSRNSIPPNQYAGGAA